MDFITIIKYAWMSFDSSRHIKEVVDLSAKVSTNHVFRVKFTDDTFIIAKLSHFGVYEYFAEDHNIIHVLGNNLEEPFQNFLARSLIKDNQLFFHRFKTEKVDIWVVFYLPISIKQKLPRRLDEDQIRLLAREIAHFHKACDRVKNTLPKSSKTLSMDITHLEQLLEDDKTVGEFKPHRDLLLKHCEEFKESRLRNNFDRLEKLPIFMDWNIGNFSVTGKCKLYSRWDYDWFRVTTRVMDFYFLSRVVSDIGDKTVFTYNVQTLMEERFIIFLQEYHKVFPLLEDEIHCMKETYRFFLLNYVVKNGAHFFLPKFKEKLQHEVFTRHLHEIDSFDPTLILKKLKI